MCELFQLWMNIMHSVKLDSSTFFFSLFSVFNEFHLLVSLFNIDSLKDQNSQNKELKAFDKTIDAQYIRILFPFH